MIGRAMRVVDLGLSVAMVGRFGVLMILPFEGLTELSFGFLRLGFGFGRGVAVEIAHMLTPCCWACW
ncbi:hypothetical protein RHOER0001_2189 [Rhodococcus erythropolis SK121]|nr:hypothetical protein RHOER0001_2189 [Rhodococcus erythropolis SK121]